MRITVAHLYPGQLNIYADRGNIAVLEARAAWRDIHVAYVAVGRGDPLPETADLLYIGGGQDREQAMIAPDLASRASSIRAAAADGAALLAVCGGYQLLGRFYRDSTGEELKGVGLFPLHTAAGERRMIGDVLLDCADVDGVAHSIAGFENHAGRTHLDDPATALGRVVYGFGNNGEDGLEGCRVGNAVGTYLHGPLLPRNPWLADWLLARALEHAGSGGIVLEPLTDDLERGACTVASARARERGGRR